MGGRGGLVDGRGAGGGVGEVEQEVSACVFGIGISDPVMDWRRSTRGGGSNHGWGVEGVDREVGVLLVGR